MPNTETTDNAAEMKALKKQLAEAQKKLKAAQNAATSRLSLKVSQKGAVSVYGTGRFPVTLYADKWINVLDFGDQIRAFIDANEGKLATKDKPKK